MTKQEFVDSAGAPPKLAEKAWEVAEGDQDYAMQLLEPHKLSVKGKFMDGGNKFGGFLFFQWNYIEKSAPSCYAIVAGADNLMELPLDIDPGQFAERLSLELKSGTKMGGNTDIFQEALDNALSDQESHLRRAIEAGDLGEIEPAIAAILSDSLDVRSPVLSLQPVVSRQIEDIADTTPTEAQEDEEERYEIPCEIEINPVKGVPLARIQIGDLIYVDLGNVTGENVKFVKPLNKRRDGSGLIPARLVARETTEAGTMKLVVQFAQGVFGVARCGKDMSLLVPPETVAMRAFKTEKMDPVDFLEKNWVVIVTLLIALAIILIAYTFI
ncbi:MAG: hypothetical protein ACLFN5_03515 [bacterium]